jgi:cell division protein FtsW (lipid II flippase)
MRILGIVLLAIVRGPGRLTFVLRPYQKSRISITFDPSQDAKAPATSRFRRASRSGREGFQARASKKGRKASCGFPRRPQRLIFSVLSEEQGFPASWWRFGLYYW